MAIDGACPRGAATTLSQCLGRLNTRQNADKTLDIGGVVTTLGVGERKLPRDGVANPLEVRTPPTIRRLNEGGRNYFIPNEDRGYWP